MRFLLTFILLVLLVLYSYAAVEHWRYLYPQWREARRFKAEIKRYERIMND